MYGGARFIYKFDCCKSKDNRHNIIEDVSGNGFNAITNEPLNIPGKHFLLADDNPFKDKDDNSGARNKSIRALAKWRTFSPEKIKNIYDGNSGQWTLEAWLKSASPNAKNNYFCILGFGGTKNKKDYKQSIKLGFIANKTKNRTSPALLFDDGKTVHEISDNNVYCWAEQWIHLGAIYDGKKVVLYVNGKQVGSVESKEKMYPLSFALFLSDGKTQYKGSVDDIRFSDQAIDSAELGCYGPLENSGANNVSINLKKETAKWVQGTQESGVRFIWTNTYPYGDKKWIVNKIKRLELHMKKLKKHGINSVGVGYELLRDLKKTSTLQGRGDRYYGDFSKQRIDHLRRIIRAAAEENIAIMIILQTYKEPYVKLLKDKEYRKVVDIEGRKGEVLACPADWSFWQGMELPRMELVARLLSEENAVGGILYETEAYCARKFYPGYGSQKTKFCYCDHCFRDFMKKNKINAELPKGSKRYDWLCRRNLDGKYEEYMVGVFSSIYRKLFSQLRMTNPSLLAGLYQLGIDHNSDGFALGAATGELPALLFSSSEYFHGYDRPETFGFSNVARSVDFKKHLKALGANTRFLCGLITGRHWPRQYAAELSQMLKYADGYWMYDGSIFLKPAKYVVSSNPDNRSQYRLKASPEKFWNAIELINKTLPFRHKDNMNDKVLPLVTKFKICRSFSNVVPVRKAIHWKCNGTKIPVCDGKFIFPVPSKVAGKRTTFLEAAFNNLEPDSIYGFKVLVSNNDKKDLRWINLGYSRKPPYPIFYDTNFLIPPNSKKSYNYIFETKKKWGRKYWIRIGARYSEAELSVETFPLKKLHVVEFTSLPVRLPDGAKLCLGTIAGDEKIFKFRYDLLEPADNKCLMSNCNENTDVSVLKNLNVSEVKIRIKIYTDNPAEFNKCPKLCWKVWNSK
jgi:hypothetical protein